MISQAALCSKRFTERGATIVRGLVHRSLLQRMGAVMRSHTDCVINASGTRLLGNGSNDGYHESVQRSVAPPIGIGGKDGYHQLVQRSVLPEPIAVGDKDGYHALVHHSVALPIAIGGKDGYHELVQRAVLPEPIAVGGKDGYHELAPQIGIGSKDGYDKLVQQGPNRFAVPMSETDTSSIWNDNEQPPWMDFVTDVLGPESRQSSAGVIFSRPGSPAQKWHIDSPHEAEERSPAHSLGVLVALADIPVAAGPTEIAIGTHVLTNHLKRPWLDRHDMLYKTSKEVTPTSLMDSGGDAEAQLESLSAGDCIIFDERILHRGLSNTSDTERWVAYFRYSRP